MWYNTDRNDNDFFKDAVMSKILERAREVFDTEIEGLNYLKSNLNGSFEQLVAKCMETLDRGGKLVFSGVGKSGYIAKKIAATLSSVGSPSIFMHPVEARHGDLGMLQKNDLLIAVSYSGETEELLIVLSPAKRLGVDLVALTASAQSSLGKVSSLVVEMPVPREACPFNLAPTTTTTALLVLGDALAMVLLQERGFSKDDYGRRHPGGAIGRMVTMRVSDVMRTGDRLALVHPGDKVRDVIIRMGKARSGSAIVVDDEMDLLGFFADGDFRRWSEKEPRILEMTMDQVMTRHPIYIRDTALAAELLKLLEEHKIDDVIAVNEAGKVSGLVDIQDLPGLKLM